MNYEKILEKNKCHLCGDGDQNVNGKMNVAI